MESLSLMLFAASLGVTSFLVAVLYCLYKFLMRETPYQRTFLIEEVDSRHNTNDKRIVKKAKSTVRQRIIGKPSETIEKGIAKDVGIEKSALNVVLASDSKGPSAIETQPSNVQFNQSEKVEAKRKSITILEKADKARQTPNTGLKSGKKVGEEVEDVVSVKVSSTTRAIPVDKDEKLKSKASEQSSEVEQHQEKREEKKVSLKQAKEVAQLKPAKVQEESSESNTQQQHHHQQQLERKKKNKKVVEENGTGLMEQEVRLSDASPVINVQSRAVIEEQVIMEQKVMQAHAQQQQQQHQQQQLQQTLNANKKKAHKVKLAEEYDVVESGQVVHVEAKQRMAPVLSSGNVLPHVVQVNNSKQQQQQINANREPSSTDLEELKRLISDHETIIQRDQMKLKSLNETLFQAKNELASERSRCVDLETSLHGMTQKLNDEKQQLLNSFHQKELQGKKAIQLLQQELQTIKSRPNDLSMIVSNLAEENAKLKSEMGRAEKQVNDEISQRMKTVELLNDALRKSDHFELNNKTLEMKFHEAEERIRSLDLKQKEKVHLEKMFYDLQQENQHIKMQSQPNVELQNQLMSAKLENERLQAIVDQLQITVNELEKRLFVATKPEVVTESVHQQTFEEMQTTVNGCNDADLISRLEAKISERESENHQLVDRLSAVDKNNRILESERGELLVALEKLKRQVVDMEKELESAKTPESLVVEQNVEALNESLNGCNDSESVAKLEARLAEKDEECTGLLQTTKVKDAKIEDLRTKNWKAMEALAQYEKRLESSVHEHESSLRELKCEVESLKTKLAEAEKMSHRVEVAEVCREEVPPLSSKVCSENPETENVKQLKMVTRTSQIYLDGQEEEINSLNRELLEQRTKNDKLREKNWTIMTSLNESDKKMQGLYKELEEVKEELARTKASLSSSAAHNDVHDQQTAKDSTKTEVIRREYTIVNEVKESCQWDMSQLVLDLDTKTAELEILQAILDQHESSIMILKSQNEEFKKKSRETGHDDRIVDLEQKVEHYKNVLMDTESILRTLEASVNAEENKWKSKAEKLERELTALRHRAQ